MNLLIPGGAGYIGSHMVRYAQDHGYEVVVLDNFSSGHKWAINDCEILNVDLLDQDKLSKLLKGRNFDGVIHFAAKSLVAESIARPDLYYKNNFTGTLNLVNEMIKNGNNNIVFSSTAAIFGNPLSSKIDEGHRKEPINSYGQSKLITENMLRDFSQAFDLNVTCLRYFNAAGAHESGEIGEAHDPETHLIPCILKLSLSGEGELKIFGNDYNTHDGTCIRDYVHVSDLAQAHLLALDYMNLNRGFSAFNLGNGNGYSVFDVIKSCETAIGEPIRYEIVQRRAGDPAVLVADSTLAINDLKWQPDFTEINEIIKSAWLWHNNNNKFMNK